MKSLLLTSFALAAAANSAGASTQQIQYQSMNVSYKILAATAGTAPIDASSAPLEIKAQISLEPGAVFTAKSVKHGQVLWENIQAKGKLKLQDGRLIDVELSLLGPDSSDSSKSVIHVTMYDELSPAKNLSPLNMLTGGGILADPTFQIIDVNPIASFGPAPTDAIDIETLELLK